MNTLQKYEAAYEKMDDVIAERIAKGKYTALGYSSNLDYLCEFNTDRLNRLLEKYNPDGVFDDMKAYGQIHTMQELLETIVFYCMHGVGGEAGICDVRLVEEGFEWTLGMGGTGTQAAMAMASIGCPSVVHLTDDSKEVCDMLHHQSIYTVSKQGKLIHTNHVSQSDRQEIHCIIQFKKGEKIRLGALEIEIPSSNRLILANMTVNVKLPFHKPFFTYVEQYAKDFTSNVLSSFNEVQNLEILFERLSWIKKHLTQYRKRNPTGIVFFEDAHYHNCEIRRLCMEELYPKVDIVSLNEDELKYTFEMLQYEKDIGDVISCVEGMKFIQKKFGIRKGVIVHTKDYAMYVGVQQDFDMETGLLYGNMLATGKAMNGWYGNREQIRETLKLAPSVLGESMRNVIMESKYRDEVVLVPSKYIDKPNYTIGLGDSFVAGVQMCFV